MAHPGQIRRRDTDLTILQEKVERLERLDRMVGFALEGISERLQKLQAQIDDLSIRVALLE